MSAAAILRNFALSAAKALVGSAAFLLVVYAVDLHLWQGVALWIGAFWYALATALLFAFWLRPVFMQEEFALSALDNEHGPAFVFLVIPCAHFCGFVLLLLGTWRTFGSATFLNLPDSPTLSVWVGFAADRLFSVVLFDANEIFGFRFNSVEHARTFLMSTLVFSYKLVASLAFISVIVEALRFTRFVNEPP